MEIPNLFKYHKVKAENGVTISPSQLSTLFTNPGEWYRTTVLGEPNPFKGNQATVTGTICHHVYECLTKGIEPDYDDINRQLDEYAKIRPDLELNVPKTISDYTSVSQVVSGMYNLRSDDAKIEHEILSEMVDGIWIGGHIDRIEDDTIVDFKTVKSKPNESEIPIKYRLQLMAYAAACVKEGMDIKNIRIVYGVKPTKTLPARCFIVTEPITEDHEKLIEYTINIISCSLEKCKFDPTLVPLIFKDFDTVGMI